MKNLLILSFRQITPAALSGLLKITYDYRRRTRKTKTRVVILLSLCLMLVSGAAKVAAQAPQQFSFQGVAKAADGKVVSNKAIAYSFKIHQGSSNGQVVYEHEGIVNTNASGVFNVTVGNSFNPIPATIEWGANSHYLQVGIDPDGVEGGGIFFTDLGTTQLISVPYAIHSNEAGKWRDNQPIVQKGILGGSPALSAVGIGSKLIWHPRKAAFRVGYGINDDWEEGSIGVYSFAAGNGPKASGTSSISMGQTSQALADNAIAMGYNATANAANAIAFGEGVTASASHAVSIGQGNIANGANSLAMGLNTTANGNGSVAIGTSTTANQIGSIAIGNNAYAPGVGGISIGQYTTASASYSIALGRFNHNGDVPNGSGTDRLFQIGNGTGINDRSNAMTVLRNGNIGIGANSINPEYLLDIDGRIRIKHNGNTSGLWLGSADGNSNHSIFMGAQGSDGSTAGFYFPGQGWTFWIGGTGSGHFSDRVYAVEFVENSDLRLKTNLNALSNSLHNLRHLNGYNYNWKNGDEKRQVGVIAQEVEKYFPELVYTKEDGYKAVRYTGLIPHLIEAVKELDKRTEEITALKQQIASLQEMNKKLQALEASVKSLLEGHGGNSIQTGK